MSIFENHGLNITYLIERLNDFRLPLSTLPAAEDALLGNPSGSYSQFNDNVIGNNAAILLTDNAQSTVNFLYVNPIEFFNNGRASDIYLDISAPNPEPVAPAAAPTAAVTEFVDEKPEEGEADLQINDNVIGNNSAILLTDDAQSTVNFLYINPIEFFNNGRASDIYININKEGETPVGAEQGLSQPGTGNQAPVATPSNLAGDTAQSDAGPFATFASFEDRAFEFLDGLDLSPAEAFDLLGSFERPDPLTFLSGLVPPREFNPEDFLTDDVTDAIAGLSGGSSEINDNVVGNNSAILLTDNAQSTVNFLYVNPIQFFNDGRGGDIHLDITLGPNDELFIL